MFNALVTACLLANPEICAPRFLPVETASQDKCQTAAEAILADWPPVYSFGEITCGAEILPSPATFSEVAPGVYAHAGAVQDVTPENKGDVSNIGVVIGTDSIAVIDSGGSRAVGEAVFAAIRTLSDLPISHVILTHMHPDHVFGASVFAELGVEIVGHPSLQQALSARAENYKASFDRLVGEQAMIGSVIIPPTIAVSERTEIDLGDRILTLDIWPLAHTGTDLTVLDTASGTFFTGDLVFHDHTPALDGSLLGWEKVLAAFDDMAIQRIVPGHGAASLPWPEGGVDLRRYLSVLKSDTRAAIADGQSLGDAVEVIAQDEAAFWALFDLFNPRNATVAFTELEWE